MQALPTQNLPKLNQQTCRTDNVGKTKGPGPTTLVKVYQSAVFIATYRLCGRFAESLSAAFCPNGRFQRTLRAAGRHPRRRFL